MRYWPAGAPCPRQTIILYEMLQFHIQHDANPKNEQHDITTRNETQDINTTHDKNDIVGTKNDQHDISTVHVPHDIPTSNEACEITTSKVQHDISNTTLHEQPDIGSSTSVHDSCLNDQVRLEAFAKRMIEKMAETSARDCASLNRRIASICEPAHRKHTPDRA
jgi:hypothetical protein